MSEEPNLADLMPCFEGAIGAAMTTVDREGVPNTIQLSRVEYVDERHLALSRQFFNKTAKNLQDNPRACVLLYDPRDYTPYNIWLRWLRSETEGALFERMRAQIDVIASFTGMSGVFRLLAAEVFEVERIVRIDGYARDER